MAKRERKRERDIEREGGGRSTKKKKGTWNKEKVANSE